MSKSQTSEALELDRARAVIDIIKAINSNETTEAIVVRIHDTLTPLVPCDRFTFGLVVWGLAVSRRGWKGR